MQRIALALIAAVGLALIGRGEAHAGIAWVQGETVDGNTTNIAVCNDGYIHAVRGPQENPRVEYNYAPGRWRPIYSLPYPGQISCASASWSPYQNRVMLQPDQWPVPPAHCWNVSPEIRSCASPIWGPPGVMVWDYWWYPDAPQNFRQVNAIAHGQQLSAPNDSAILRFDSARRVASVQTLTGGVSLSGSLHSAKRVASTTQNGRTVVVALNDDNTFWINREAAPGALNLNPGPQWRQIGTDALSRFLGAFVVDMEVAVVNNQLKAYVLLRSGATAFLYSGAITE